MWTVGDGVSMLDGRRLEDQAYLRGRGSNYEQLVGMSEIQTDDDTPRGLRIRMLGLISN